MKELIRVRFAPSPTGFMHLGNVRIALINYLFAHQKKGKFILRIEDTDIERDSDDAAYSILFDLKWLDLKYNEGPGLGGKYEPYFQSKRRNIYQIYLNQLIENQLVYRCFCSEKLLDEKRKQQLASDKPPRYDRTCLHLSDDHIKQKLVANIPFIWRFKLNDDQVFDIDDMVKGKIHFEMKNFSDFALTRSDGSFTFMFANFVDDWLMKVTHVIRGEDHLSNTAMQAALFFAFAFKLPKFWHLPMLCNIEGKKLSKRDFGFSLEDLRKDGFLPQAICNYLGIIGISFKNEIQSLGELTKNFDFKNIHSTGSIKFDMEKLIWINHKWIERLPIDKLVYMVKPFLFKQFPESKKIDDKKIEYLIAKIQTDMKTLKDVGTLLEFYFITPDIKKEVLEDRFGKEKNQLILDLLKNNVSNVQNVDSFINSTKKEAKEKGVKVGELFGTMRYLLTGSFSGMQIHDILNLLRNEEVKKRLSVFF